MFLISELSEELSKIDSKLLNLLAFQRIQQLLPSVVGIQSDKGPAAKSLPTLSHYLIESESQRLKIKDESSSEIKSDGESTQKDITFGSFEKNLSLKDGVLLSKKQYVAIKDCQTGLGMQEITPNNINPSVHAIRDVSQVKISDFLKNEFDRSHLEVKARAVLTPLCTRNLGVKMKYRTLSIGTGADNDVCLSDFGYCNYVSSKHAVIFYDEVCTTFKYYFTFRNVYCSKTY